MKYLIPVFIDKYITPSGTFIYRQLQMSNEDYEQILLTSSKVENFDKFPFEKIYAKPKKKIELLSIKFYEKILRDRFFFNKKYRILSPSQKKFFSKFLNSSNIKFIHAHYGTSALEIHSVTKSLGKKLLVSFHGYDASSLLNSKAYVNQFKDIIKDIYVITPSRFMRDKLIKELGEAKKYYVIFYGIPLEFYEFTERKPIIKKMAGKEKIRFLQISNFVHKKGHLITVKAFSPILKKYPNVELIFGGKGYTLNSTKLLVKEMGLDKQIKFLGLLNQSEVKTEMQKADAFVHHSIYAPDGEGEGIPNVIMEAMATGLPVISTFHEGIPELITDNENGFLVNENDVKNYTKKIETILNSDIKSIIVNARKTIEENFNLSKQLQKLDNVYRELLN